MIDLATWNLTIPVGVPATTIATPCWSVVIRTTTSSPMPPAYFLGARQWQYHQRLKLPAQRTARDLCRRQTAQLTYLSADNYLSATLKLNQVPSSGRVVIGQIHGYKNDMPMLCLSTSTRQAPPPARWWPNCA